MHMQSPVLEDEDSHGREKGKTGQPAAHTNGPHDRIVRAARQITVPSHMQQDARAHCGLNRSTGVTGMDQIGATEQHGHPGSVPIAANARGRIGRLWGQRAVRRPWGGRLHDAQGDAVPSSGPTRAQVRHDGGVPRRPGSPPDSCPENGTAHPATRTRDAGRAARTAGAPIVSEHGHGDPAHGAARALAAARG